MYAVRVIPLAALPSTVPQVLDYFWTAPLPRGALVGVTVGRRGVQGIVLESSDLARGKLAFKKASFSLKKLDGVICGEPQATEGQLSLAHWLAQQYAAGPALCIKTVLPSFLGKRGKSLHVPAIGAARRKGRTSFVLSQPDTALTRMEQACAQSEGQTLILVPEIGLARVLVERFRAHAPMLVHGGMTARATLAAHRGVIDGTVRVVVGTRTSLFLPWHSLRRIIIEDPQHEAYKSDSAPRYAAPDVARQLATMHGADVTVLTPALSTTHAYIAQKTDTPIVHEKPFWPSVTTVSMAQERATGNRGLFSRVATDALLDAHDRREPVLLYSGRRAYATSVSCAVCHTPSLCTTCGIPMRLHRTTEDFLVCYRCTAFVPVPSRCPACQTGTFRPAGLAGSQRVAESLATLLDRHGLTKVRAPVLDSDLVRTDDQEDDLLARLDAMTWPVLVATSMVFGHRYQRSFSLIVIPQTDALTVNPDFRTQERLIWQLEKLADFRPHTMILQAWHDGGILGLAKERRWDEALAEELVQRKALGWPPYTRLVKISFGHVDGAMARRAAATGAERLTRAVAHLKVGGKVAMFGPTPALAGHGAGRWVEHVILKTTLGSEVLSHLLAHVPSGAVVDIDPRSIT